MPSAHETYVCMLLDNLGNLVLEIVRIGDFHVVVLIFSPGRKQGVIFGTVDVDAHILLENRRNFVRRTFPEKRVKLGRRHPDALETHHKGIQSLGRVIFIISVTHIDAGSTVVRNDNHGRIAILPRIVKSNGHGPVECSELRENAGSVIGMSHEIHLAALHHQEEAFPVP